MTATGSAPAVSPWTLRRARAVHSLDKAPHAEELLGFYVGLIEIQERVAERVPVERWLPLVRSIAGTSPLLLVDQLPVDELVPGFEDFLGRIADVGTEVITEDARALLDTDGAHRSTVLRAALGAARSETAETEPDSTAFHARAFLEPVITALASDGPPAPLEQGGRRCMTCGGQPQVAVLRDLPDAVGRRTLVCSTCATEWRFPRLTCPGCGETNADRLPVHTAESVAHVRIDECRTCRRYLKSVDQRQQGAAVPLVDEVATVELDLWAREQGLTKIRTNVLGL